MHLQVDTTYLLKFKRRFKNGNILINFLHLKFGSVNYLIESIFLAAFSKIFVWKMFYQLLSKHLWRKIFLVKFRVFCTFFLIALNECIWSIKTLLWETSYFRHSITFKKLLKTTKTSMQKLRVEYFEMHDKWKLRVLLS